MNRSIGFIYKASSKTIRNNVKFATATAPKPNICNININTFTTSSSTTTTNNTSSNNLSNFKNESKNKINNVNNNINSNNVYSLLQISSFGDDDGT